MIRFVYSLLILLMPIPIPLDPANPLMMIIQQVEDFEQGEQDEEEPRRWCNDFFHARRDYELGLADVAFRRRVGFTRPHFERLLQLVGNYMRPRDNRGKPMPLKIKVLGAVLCLRGNTHLEESGCNVGISGNGTFLSLHQFVECLVDFKDTFIVLPTLQECEELSLWNLEKYGIRGIPVGIDGKLFRFMGKPRFGIPPTILEAQGQDYWSYKGAYGINAQIVGDGTYFRDIICHQPGRMNDASIFNGSNFNALWSIHYRPYVCVGDSAYPISVSIVTPHTTRELSPNPEIAARQREFNSRLSGIRTEQTENMFGRLVMQYPILNQLRYFVEFNEKVILACCILFNFKAHCIETDNEDEYDEDELPPPEVDQINIDAVYMNDASAQVRRENGQLGRRTMMNNMQRRGQFLNL